MNGGKPRQTLPHNHAAVLLLRYRLRIIGAVRDRVGRALIELLLRTNSQYREGFVAGDGQDPSGNPGLGFETIGLAPHVEKDLVNDVLGRHGIAGEPQHETVDPHLVPQVKRLQRALVAGSNRPEQSFVGSCLHGRQFTGASGGYKP